MSETEAIRFECAVEKVQTMADGSVRIWLSLPETALLAAAQLMACQAHGVYLKAELKPDDGKSGDTTGG